MTTLRKVLFSYIYVYKIQFPRDIKWRSHVMGLMYIELQIRKAGEEINLHPRVKYDHHRADFNESHAFLIIFENKPYNEF